ncbi:MAG: sodium:alanine symporter family protein [Chromatiales bacterium]|nr:MAG: sodium:alanine symporter family protein [Chromatiales bacterium]
MDAFNRFLIDANSLLWHDSVLFIILGTGVLFTIWSGFSQYRALTHGVTVLRGRYDNPDDPGAINHFQALSAALSATVGLGNIGGVAMAISLGGPGAVFWMWVVGAIGMALKLTEVTLSMLYRNTEDPDNPHGGPMWVISKSLARHGPGWAKVGKAIGSIFCVTLLISTMTAGNMFQSWNVGEITEHYFGVPSILTGIVLAILVGMVIIGGIKRIGAVAGRLVPIMLILYLVAGSYVLAMNIDLVPAMFTLIVKSAFVPAEATGAFIGGAAGYAFLFGMKRALFSNEVGQGSSPIAHSAAKTSEPVREAVVAGLEPFIDTIVVCTLTALVIMSTGVWNRDAALELAEPPAVSAAGDGVWQLADSPLPADSWAEGGQFFIIVSAHPNKQSKTELHRIPGTAELDANGALSIVWTPFEGPQQPETRTLVYESLVGATLTARAFDSVTPGLGKWLVTIASWLFAISTMISWSYYGEQGSVFLAGERSVMVYKLVFCLLCIVATAGFLKTDAQLDNLTGIGTGVMLFANLPIMWLLGRQAMLAYHNYIERLDDGRIGKGHAPPSLEDLISGRDVER